MLHTQAAQTHRYIWITMTPRKRAMPHCIAMEGDHLHRLETLAIALWRAAHTNSWMPWCELGLIWISR